MEKEIIENNKISIKYFQNLTFDIPAFRKNSIQFWMLRTQMGIFYDEFIKEKYIAIGWDLINKSAIKNNSSEQLKQILIKNYNEQNKNLWTCIHKCTRFIYEMNNNDIIVIVGPKQVAFAKVGDYFEVEMDTSTATKYPNKCPYIKRRHIEILNTVDLKYINPALYKSSTFK